LETDLKKDSLANKTHEKKLICWNDQSVTHKEFEKDWLIIVKQRD